MASAISRISAPPTGARMVSEMSNRQTIMWVAVAFVFHVVLIGATSLSYIHDRWIDPAGAAARAQAADAAEAQKLASDSAPPTATQSPVPPPAKPMPRRRTRRKSSIRRRDNPEVKKVTEAAKPGEIPKNPTHQGFDLDDSSLK